MKEQNAPGPTRRNFLRSAAAVAVFSQALGPIHVEAEEGVDGEDVSILAQIKTDRDLYEHDQVLSGTLRFLRAPQSPVRVQWIDSYGRVAGERIIPAPSSLASPVPFAFDLKHGLTCMNSIRVKINGAVQAVGFRFMRSPAPAGWDDYQVISWAHYPHGFYDQLRAAGVNATIAYREGDFSNALDNNFNFYVEQMAWEVFAIYHKDQPLWRDLLTKVRADRGNLDHWIRKPCLNDPATDAYIREHVQRYVRQHRAFRPLYYNIADELGQGDQVQANDFCHSEYCAVAFAEYLRKSYGPIQGVQAEWALDEVVRWDDEGIRSGREWQKTHMMISRTSTDAAFESIAIASLAARYGTMTRFNKEWGTTFPVPAGGLGARETWEPVVGLVRESLSFDLTEAALEKALGPMDRLNARCGSRAGWNAPQTPTTFKTWSEIKAFLNRYDKELGEIQSTRGWNVAPWSDFRNFMDSTFADAVGRAADACRAEDPHARCATEGGQAPFAFGWYNYEQVLRVVDVIEPYNIGNNVEVIRSLKPETIMLSTLGFDHKPGTPMTTEDRLRQRQAVRPVWWELFHSHQGTIIWDDNEETSTFVDQKRGLLTVCAETFSDAFHELRNGLGMLVMNSSRTHDGIAIHYSHPSIQAHWLLENLKKARLWMVDTVEAYVTSRFIAVRNSWTKLIEDLQLQYNFVSASQVASGELNSGKYRIFIMPESIAVSPAEAEQIRGFVQGGGVVVADFRAAHLNQHCRDLGAGQLNDVFGIGEGQLVSAGSTHTAAKGEASEGSLELAGKDLGPIAPADSTLTTTTGNALARSGGVSMIVANRLGAGRAVYLNMDMSDYAFDRLNPRASSVIPDLIAGVMGLAAIAPRVRVLGADGKRLPGTEVVIFKNGACEQVAIFRNPQLDDGGWGAYASKKPDWRDWTTSVDNAVFEKEASVTIEWPTALPTYDVRGRKDLGSVQSLKTTLSPWEPLVLVRAPRPLAVLKFGVAPSAAPGTTLDITIAADGEISEGTIRVVHVDFEGPSGKRYEAYSRNLSISTFPHPLQLPIAFNDPKGIWRIRGLDLMTGQSFEASFTVAEAAKS